jgi:uncharacterized RDD family membrane protein YckC
MGGIDLSTLMPGEQAPQDLRPAKIHDRLIAYLFDTLPFVFGYHLSLPFAAQKLPELAGQRNFPLVVAAAWAGVYVLYQLAGNLAGGTIGKKLLGLAVLHKSGERLGFGGSVLRALGSVLSTPANLGYVLALFHPESRALHDLLAGSVVVESREKSPGETGLMFFFGLGAVVAMLAGTYLLTVRATTPTELGQISQAQLALKELAKYEEDYKAANGRYTDSMVELAKVSGDPETFNEWTAEYFDPALFELKAGDIRFRIVGAARDRKRTRVVLEGPQAR